MKAVVGRIGAISDYIIKIIGRRPSQRHLLPYGHAPHLAVIARAEFADVDPARDFLARRSQANQQKLGKSKPAKWGFFRFFRRR